LGGVDGDVKQARHRSLRVVERRGLGAGRLVQLHHHLVGQILLEEIELKLLDPEV
jgi:hypothetical protein